MNGFEEWYKRKQEILKEDPVAKFFVKTRNEIEHEGLTPLNSGQIYRTEKGSLKVEYYFGDGLRPPADGAPQTDAVSACNYYLMKLIEIIFDCYSEFGPEIDPDQYYTLENLKKKGLTIEDIEEELGIPRGWTDIGPGYDEEKRLHALRCSFSRTQIDEMFEKYLGRTRFSDTTST